METILLRSPVLFQELLQSKGQLDRLYEALGSGDNGEVVMTALSILKDINVMPPLVKQMKDKIKSAAYRNDGNEFFKGSNHQKALEYYNKALMCAPNGSEELVLAYSNRSALLFELDLFQECINDIETCLSLGCPSNIIGKLNKRLAESKSKSWKNKLAKNMAYSKFVDEFFQIGGRRNPQIPCASTDVGVIVKSKIPTVVAVNEIKVGKVLAVEPAFNGSMETALTLVACHYCYKISLNLQPCKGCCHVLYCSSDCAASALKEYHRVECAIIEFSTDIDSIPINFASLRAAIKMKDLFDTWEEFNEATTKLGTERTKASEINDIFDGNNKFSMLNLRDDRVFMFGNQYNFAFGCAILMNYLGCIKSFFPTNKDDKAVAMRAFSRLLMHFSLHSNLILTTPTLAVTTKRFITYSKVGALNVFPFAGKLKHACEANTLTVNLNNKVALIAIKPLKPGTELTISCIGHYIDNQVDGLQRQRNLFLLYGTACDCVICVEDLELLAATARLNETQMRCYENLNIQMMLNNFSIHNIQNIYPMLCKALAVLADQPFSKEYTTVYRLFKKCLLDIQQFHMSNETLNIFDNGRNATL